MGTCCYPVFGVQLITDWSQVIAHGDVCRYRA